MNNTENLIELIDVGFLDAGQSVLENISLTLGAGEVLGILGANGTGKSLLGRILSGELPPAGVLPPGEPGVRGIRRLEKGMDERDAAYVSFSLQSSIMEQERARDDSDFLEGALDPGRSVEMLIREGSLSPAAKAASPDLSREERRVLDDLLLRFSLTSQKDRGLRFLSTGEFRKTLICRALFARPKVLILDEPFAGLDAASRITLTSTLEGFRDTDLSMVILTSRGGDLPPFCTRSAVISPPGLTFLKTAGEAQEYYASLSGTETRELSGFLREVEEEVNSGSGKRNPASQTLVEMRNVSVSYYETPVLKEITWFVREGEHWQISGPNGAGKSTLLSLVNGDSPKAYGQEICLFGKKRGTGETVWEIKQKIGFVSGAFHLGYLVKQKVLGVVLSGFFDSVGLYDKPTPVQKETAILWCRRLGLEPFLDSFFGNLSFGVQRTVLLARAMIKDPEILILDEPCQGLDDAHTGVVLAAVEYIASRNHSNVLYVSHEAALRIPSIKNNLILVPHSAGGFTAEIS